MTVGLLEREELLFEVVDLHVSGNDLTVLEVLPHLLVLDVVLETADVVVLDMLTVIRPRMRNGRRLNHADKVREVLAAAVVRRGGSEDEALAALSEQRGEVAPLAGTVGDDMALVNDHYVPAGLLDVMTELRVVLQGIDRDDGPVIVLERVLVCGNLRADLVYSVAVQPLEGQGKAVPHLFLELREDGLECNDKDPLSPAALDEFGEHDSHLDSLSQAHAVRYEEPRARELERFPCGRQLVVCMVIGALKRDGKLIRGVRIATHGVLQIELREGVPGIVVRYEHHLLGVNQDDIILDSSVEDKLLVLDQLREPFCLNDISTVVGRPDACYHKILAADTDALTFCEGPVCFFHKTTML